MSYLDLPTMQKFCLLAGFGTLLRHLRLRPDRPYSAPYRAQDLFQLLGDALPSRERRPQRDRNDN